MLFERMRFVEMLYEGLPDKTKVKTSRCVVGIEQNDLGVKILLADGTYETGDIVIGADGVHSSVWRFIQSDVLRDSPQLGPENDLIRE